MSNEIRTRVDSRSSIIKSCSQSYNSSYSVLTVNESETLPVTVHYLNFEISKLYFCRDNILIGNTKSILGMGNLSSFAVFISF